MSGRSSRSAAAAAVLAGFVAGLAGAPAAVADDCANAEFRTGPSAHLPDCRAYEMVSPPDKDGYGLVQASTSGSPSYPSVSGDQVYYAVLTPFGGPQNGNIGHHVARRTPTGWVSRNFMPPYCREDQSGIINTMAPSGLSEDFSTAILHDPSDSNCAAGDENGQDVYRVDPDGTLGWVSHNGAPKLVDERADLQALSADASHVVFATPEKLVLPLEAGRATGKGLYDRTGGIARPVALADDGSLVNDCGAAIAGDSSSTVPGRISADGRVIFFHSGSNASVPGCSAVTDDGGQLYARVDHQRTVMLSESRRTVPDTRRVPQFLGASRDGSRAYLKSTEMLTDDAATGGGLYVYDLSAVLSGDAAGGELRFLSPSTNGAAANVEGRMILGEAPDGSTVYFVATGVLASGVAADGLAKLYVWREGVGVEYVSHWTDGTFNVIASGSVSPDGGKAAFIYRPSGSSFSHAYLYDGTDVVCVSCAPGLTPTANVRFFGAGGGDRPAHWGAPTYVTDDGRVFFTSTARLVAGDVNSKYDVYEYVDGEHRLLSAGTGRYESLLIGVTAQGRDAFFVTSDALHGSDYDNGDQDVYVARVGGGFPEPAREAGGCDGDACQPPIQAPSLRDVGTVGFAGSGNAAQPPRVAIARLRAARGAMATIRVRVPAAGRIAVSGRLVRNAGRTVRSAATYRLPVRLNARAKRRLARGKRVRTAVRVAFRPAAGGTVSRRLTVTFKPKAKRGKRSARAGTKGGR